MNNAVFPPIHFSFSSTNLCRLLLQVSCSLLEAEVALLVGTAGTETNTDERGPCSSLEQKDGKDNTETEAEGRLDEEVREAAIPLAVVLAIIRFIQYKCLFSEGAFTFSLRSDSLSGREMALGAGRVMVVSAMMSCPGCDAVLVPAKRSDEYEINWRT